MLFLSRSALSVTLSSFCQSSAQLFLSQLCSFCHALLFLSQLGSALSVAARLCSFCRSSFCHSSALSLSLSLSHSSTLPPQNTPFRRPVPKVWPRRRERSSARLRLSGAHGAGWPQRRRAAARAQRLLPPPPLRPQRVKAAPPVRRRADVPCCGAHRRRRHVRGARAFALTASTPLVNGRDAFSRRLALGHRRRSLGRVVLGGWP